MSEIIQYEEVIQNYNESLNNVLRGFRPKYDFLELWVPDSNHARSIKNLIEAARYQGHTSLSLFLSKAILTDIDFKALLEELNDYGHIESELSNNGALLHVNRTQATNSRKAADAIHALYREKIMEFYNDLSHQGSILEDGDYLPIRSNEEGISLFGAINPNNHVIHIARFSGSNKPVEAGLLEGLCRVIEGLPIQEAYDHSVLKLESILRDKSQPVPVKGIINVFNYPPMFQLPLKLIRSLYGIYLAKTNSKMGDNDYYPEVSQKWKALPNPEKLSAVNRVFKQLLQTKNTPYYGLDLQMQLINIEGHHRLSIVIQGEISPSARAKLYLDLETFLQREVEPRLEVFSQDLKDRNTIRRTI